MPESKDTHEVPFIVVDDGEGQVTINAGAGPAPRSRALEPVESPYSNGRAVKNQYAGPLSEQHVVATTEEDMEALFNLAKKGDQ